MATVNRATMVQNIWQNFYDRLSTDVTTITLTDTTTKTIQHYASAYSDKDFESRTSFPIMVIDTPRLSSDFFTLGRTQVSGTIDVEIYDTRGESVDRFLSAIMESIETYKGNLADDDLHLVEVDGTDSDMVERGFKIHMRRVTFRFMFRHDKTNAY